MEKTAYLQRIHDHLKSAYLLNEDRIEVMIPVFIRTLRSHMNQLTELAENGNGEQLAKASHAVKGAFLNIGLTDLAETAQGIETRCKNGSDPHACRRLIDDLRYIVTLLSADW